MGIINSLDNIFIYSQNKDSDSVGLSPGIGSCRHSCLHPSCSVLFCSESARGQLVFPTIVRYPCVSSGHMASNSLVFQWLGLDTPTDGAPVRSLVRELRSHKSFRADKRKGGGGISSKGDRKRWLLRMEPVACASAWIQWEKEGFLLPGLHMLMFG